MMEGRKYTQKQYEEFLYFADEDGISHHSQKIVKTRVDHECVSLFDTHDLPKGSLAIRESAIDADVGRVSNYICLDCADRYISEME